MAKKLELKEDKSNKAMFETEDRIRLEEDFSLLVGVDEAGRGPLAGPVVAAAVCLKDQNFTVPIRDSKKLSARQRERAFHEIYENALVGVGIISETVIDQLNILEATYVAMTNAVNEVLSQIPHVVRQETNFNEKVCLLIDGGRFKSDLPYTFKTIVRGDTHVFSIACASIVAKVTRDRILEAYDRVFPQYGFKRHKGYPTAQHKLALRQWGPSMIHRKTFHY